MKYALHVLLSVCLGMSSLQAAEALLAGMDPALMADIIWPNEGYLDMQALSPELTALCPLKKVADVPGLEAYVPA